MALCHYAWLSPEENFKTFSTYTETSVDLSIQVWHAHLYQFRIVVTRNRKKRTAWDFTFFQLILEYITTGFNRPEILWSSAYQPLLAKTPIISTQKIMSPFSQNTSPLYAMPVYLLIHPTFMCVVCTCVYMWGYMKPEFVIRCLPQSPLNSVFWDVFPQNLEVSN